MKQAKTAKKQTRERLSNDLVAKLAVPAKGAVTAWDNDPKVAGFGVRVYSTGTRSFFLNYWFDGAEKRFTIGPFPRWSVSAARQEAIELRKRIDKGDDPAGQKRERRDAATIADLIDRYTRDHLPTMSQDPKRVADEKKKLEMIRTALVSTTKVADIHSGDIQEMHRRITETRGPVRANRVLSVASKMFSMSLVSLAGEDSPWRNAVQGNPCKGVERNREEGRERFFSPAELESIATAVAKYPPESRGEKQRIGRAAADCLRLVMLSGCRPQEAMRAKWSEFHEPGFWSKPSSHTKQKKKHRVPLAPPAIELVERLRKDRAKSATWLFPGQTPGEPVTTLDHLWTFVIADAQLAPDEQGRAARIYDLRHSFASVGAGAGLGLPIIGKLLGHNNARTTEKYAHLSDNPLKAAADTIGSTIAGKAGAKVVSIRGGAS